MASKYKECQRKRVRSSVCCACSGSSEDDDNDDNDDDDDSSSSSVLSVALTLCFNCDFALLLKL